MEFDHFKASVMLLIPTLLVMSKTSSGRLSVPNGRLCAGWCEKIPRSFVHTEGLFNIIALSSPMCPRVCALSFVPRTEALPISTLAASVKAPYLHLHSPLLASKAVLSSWSLVVICALVARERFQPELELQAGTSSFHALYM